MIAAAAVALAGAFACHSLTLLACNKYDFDCGWRWIWLWLAGHSYSFFSFPIQIPSSPNKFFSLSFSIRSYRQQQHTHTHTRKEQVFASSNTYPGMGRTCALPPTSSACSSIFIDYVLWGFGTANFVLMTITHTHTHMHTHTHTRKHIKTSKFYHNK